MLSTPKPSRLRPQSCSLGDPQRALRLRDECASPAFSAASIEDAPGRAGARARSVGQVSSAGGAPGRRAQLSFSAARQPRDPRPIQKRSFAEGCARNVVEFLSHRGFGKQVGKSVSHDKILKDPSTKEFFEIFRFLIGLLDPMLEIDMKRTEEEVPLIMRRLKYPVEVNKSKLQAISGPNTWPQLLAVLDWLVTLIQINDEIIIPIAACEASSDAGNPEREDGEHHVLRSLHENYGRYLDGRDDNSASENLMQIYEERLAALRDEIQRLEDHHTDMERRVHEHNSEHDRLIELQSAPKHLELEAHRLREVIQTQEARVQEIEAQEEAAAAGELARGDEIQSLEATAQRLAEQVASQACSKQDIQRLKGERDHLRSQLGKIQSEAERNEQEVWELGMEESRHIESVGSAARAVNEAVAGLELAEGSHQLQIRSDLSPETPIEELVALDLSEPRARVQSLAADRVEALEKHDSEFGVLSESLRVAQEKLSERERECRVKRKRREELVRVREESREWSAKQVDEARRTAEATEDKVHAVSIGTSAPTLRDAAEVDELRLELAELRAACAGERAQLEEQVQRSSERSQEHRAFVLGQLREVRKGSEAMRDWVFEQLREMEEEGEGEDGSSAPPGARRSLWPTPCRGGS